MVKDMTDGKTSVVLIKFALPIVLSGIFQQLYNMVDSIVVGKFDGVNALAAVGASYPVTMLFIAIATGGGVGCSVVISQIFGAKKMAEMKTAISTAVLSISCIAVITMLIGMLFCNPLISLLGTPAEIFDSSAAYLRIYTFGVFFLFLYNITTAIFNGLGDSKTPLFFLMFSSVLNIILDVIFVRDLGMSVEGVGWATFIAQGTASILSFSLLMYRISCIKTEEKMKYYDWTILKNMLRVALPSILQMSTIAIGQLMVQALVNGFGAIVIAGYAAAIKIDSLFKVAFMSIGTAVSSFTAQNYGAEKIARIRDGYWAALKMVVAYSVVAIVGIYIFGDALIGLFDDGSSGDGVVSVGVSFMRTVVLVYPLFALMMMGNGVLRGTGRMKEFTIATIVDLVLRVGLSYALISVLGYQAIWYAIAIGWIIGSMISTYYYKKAEWTVKR